MSTQYTFQIPIQIVALYRRIHTIKFWKHNSSAGQNSKCKDDDKSHFLYFSLSLEAIASSSNTPNLCLLLDELCTQLVFPHWQFFYLTLAAHSYSSALAISSNSLWISLIPKCSLVSQKTVRTIFLFLLLVTHRLPKIVHYVNIRVFEHSSNNLSRCNW